MASRTDFFDLGALRLSAGQGRRLELAVPPPALELGGQPYAVAPDPLAVVLDISRMTAGGYALRLRFEAGLDGACMRCLAPAAPTVAVDAREVDQAEGGEDLDSPYVAEAVLDLAGWARDALVMALPIQVLCRPDCAGLCAQCGADLNADPGHAHERERDPRWAKLDEISFE